MKSIGAKGEEAMMRTIRHHKPYALAVYDDSSGSIAAMNVSDGAVSGDGYPVAGTLVVLYADDGQLVLQVGKDRFPLGSTTVVYEHDWNSSTTVFRVMGGSVSRELAYRSWWADQGIAPDEVKFCPERDEEEDHLAWIASVWRDKEVQARLLAGWSTHRRGMIGVAE